MEQFLQETKSYLTKEINNDKKIHVVIGNEACDLDSVVSALTYGYFFHKTVASSQTLCLPVLNTQKSHFHLKTDTKFLLSKTGISPECLTFRDDLDLHDLHQQGRLSLTLVDHNVLVGGDVALEDSVTMVIDHRPLERKPSDRVKVVQDLVGSCSTLVAGILLDCPEFTLCPLTTTLLLGTILVDTVNTSPEAGKTTPLDQEMLRRLTQVVPELDKDKLYADVQEAKNDISALSTREVLEKDLKCVVDGDRSVVMSSIPVSLEVFLCRPDVVEAMNSVMHDRKGQSVVVMTMHVNKGVPCREILIFSSSEAETKKLAEFLEKNQEIDLSFRPLTCDLKSSLAYYQGNVKASRKKVLPLVKSYLQAINIPQDDLLLNFDPLGSAANSDSLLDFSDNSAFSSVPRDSSVENTNPVFLLDPGNSNNSSTSQDLLGLFDNSRTNPKINITLPKSAEGPSSSSGIPDLLGDFTEADIMESPLRTPDLMQSLSEASSGPGSTFNSRPGSGYPSHTVTPPETATPPNSLIFSGFHTNNEFTLPSMNNAEIIEKIQQKKSQMVPHGSKNPKGELTDNYPFTPNNSVADVQFDSLAREHSLRTLNNSQMVQQVEQKRRSLGGEVELSSSSGVENVPFTPQNSFVSEQFSEFYSRESSLPSLNNAEMLQRIQEKRAGMGGGGGDIAEDREEEDSVPFTPQNSFMESSFDLMVKEHILPSMNNADMVRQVQKKRSSLSSRLVDTEPAVPPADGPSNRLVDPSDGGDLGESYSPFTPQNSFVESSLEKYNKEDLDFNSLNSRLLDISQDKVAIAQPLVPNLLDLDPLTFDPTTIVPENVVAKKIAESMVLDAEQTPGSQLLDLGFDDDSDHGDRAAKDHGNSSGTMEKDGTPGAPREGSQSSESGSKKGDSPLQDVAFSLAGELIEHVLDNFQPEGGIGNSLLAGSHAAGGGPDVLEPMLVEPVEEKRQIPVVTINNVDPESPLRKAASTNQLIALETDYLSKVDPFHGNYDLVTNQGDREVVESSSFRRISGESPKTVREEILKAISPEKESPATSDKEPSATSDIESSAGVAGKPGEWNEGGMGKISADRKMEEGREENDGIKIVVDTDDRPSSPLLHAAQNLTEAVIKNAVEVIQSEKKDTLDLQSPPELNVENVTPGSESAPESINEKVTPDIETSSESINEKVTPDIETLSESIDEKDSPDLQSSPELNMGKAAPDYKSKEENAESLLASTEEKAESLPASTQEKSTPDSNSSPESIDEKVSESIEKKDTVSQSSSESNDENVIPSSDTSTESMEEKVIPDSQSLSQSIDEEITHDSQSSHESNEEKVIPDSQSSSQSIDKEITHDSQSSPESNEEKVIVDSQLSSRSIDEEITHDSQSSPESNEEKVSPSSQSMFDFDSVDSTEESGSSPSDEASSTTEASYRLSSPECTGGVESEDRVKGENSCIMQDSDRAKEEISCLTQESDPSKEEISCLTQESDPSKAENSCLTQESERSKADNSCLTQESNPSKEDNSCLTQESDPSKEDNSCLTQESISNESLSSHAGVRSDGNLDSVQKSGLSFGSISNESLSSFSGLKSDQNLERAGNVGLSTGSISNESLASYSGVKSDTNLLDLQEEVFSAPNESVPNDPPSIKVTESAKAEVTDESSMVLFKVESDDNLDEKSDEMSRSNEGVSGDTMTTGPGSIVEDEDVQGSESFLSADLTPTTPVDEEGTLKSASSNEGLASMSTSTDTFGVTDSSAGKTAAAENLDETKKTPSNDMTDQEKKFKDRLGGLDLSDEWQEDDIPGMPPAENVSDSSDSEGSRSRHSSNSSYSSTELSAVRSSLSAHPKKKITANLNILSDDLDDDGMDPGDGLEWENDTPIKQIEPIPQFTAQDEYKESKLWKGVEIGGKSMKIDLKVIEPYKRVLSHGGYYGDGLNAIIIFAGCYLPDRSRRDYQYVMDNLFMYVISTLETLVAEDYMIVYFHGATPRRQMPSFGWLKKCYQMIDRRLRKNLKSLLLIHPTLWLKTIVMMTRPFISAKFSSKLRFVRSLSDLGQIIPMEYINVPEQVQQYDDRLLQHRSRVTSPLSQSPEPLTSPS